MQKFLDLYADLLEMYVTATLTSCSHPTSYASAADRLAQETGQLMAEFKTALMGNATYAVVVPVDVGPNIWKDPRPGDSLKFTGDFRATLNCGCEHVEESLEGYGHTAEEAVADLWEQVRTGQNKYS